jgi:hypothetical protein
MAGRPSLAHRDVVLAAGAAIPAAAVAAGTYGKGGRSAAAAPALPERTVRAIVDAQDELR